MNTHAASSHKSVLVGKVRCFYSNLLDPLEVFYSWSNGNGLAYISMQFIPLSKT